MKGYVRSATLHDAEHVARHIRPEDRAELMVIHRSTDVALAAYTSVLHSDVALAICTETDEVVGLCGCGAVGREAPGIGSVWMVGTPELVRPPMHRELIRHTPAILDLFHMRYPVLMNYVWANNTRTLNWLRHLGFILTPIGNTDILLVVHTQQTTR